MSRLVYVLARRTAAETASAPLLRNCTISAQGMTLLKRSATSTSRTFERPATLPLPTAIIAAS
jgi:hypothetical protein